MFKREIRDAFNIDVRISPIMSDAIERYYDITAGNPPWLDPEDDVKSINFAEYVSEVAAGMTVLDIGIKTSGGARADWMQKQADYIIKALPDKVAVGLGNTGFVIKPNGQNVDYIEPGNFYPTDTNSNGDILGCVFRDSATRTDGRNTYYYTRLEWHRFENIKTDDGSVQKVYKITNRAYKSESENSIGDPCELSEVAAWANTQPEVALLNVARPLFGYFKNPAPNYIDHASALGLPIWAKCEEELRDLDIAWSRKASEVEDSKHMTFVSQSVQQYANTAGPGRRPITLPRFVKSILYSDGLSGENAVHEHTATMLTDERIRDINSILAMISTKCGFSQGMFKLDEKTGMMTATQVEADDQETVRTIKNIRDNLQSAVDDALYALDVMATLYNLAPVGNWEVDYSFGDLLYNFHEDQQHHYALAMQGRYPWVEYYVKFLKYSREEAEALLEQAKGDQLSSGIYAQEE